MPPSPQGQSQERIEEPQTVWKGEGQSVSLVDQMAAQFGKPVAPAVAKKEGRKATAGGPEARFVRIAFAMASSHRTQRCRLEPTLGRAVANRSRQTCRKADP